MKPYLSFITLGVADLAVSRHFYGTVLGLKPMHDEDGVVMYRLNGVVLSLFPQAELMKDAHRSGDAHGSRFSLAHNLPTEAEVDAFFAHLGKHQATITKMPEKVFWGGYSGYFADPDGHLWEIAHNPFLEMDNAGNVLGMHME
jgi:catechol 2,3-dioxygenase-like lactoylglutathione lyase family enzyme